MKNFFNKMFLKISWIWIWDKDKRKEYRKKIKEAIAPKNHIFDRFINSNQLGNDVIYNQLKTGKPCLITRFGAVEFRAIDFFCKNIDKREIIFPDSIKRSMRTNPGFFSPTNELLTKFCCDSLQIVKNADVFAPWVNIFNPSEIDIIKKYSPNSKLVSLGDLFSPNSNINTWTRILEGKKVLVIHPFEKNIKAQYAKRELLFKNPLTLPKFELKTIKTIQAIGGDEETKGFANWFEALESMYRQIDEVDFDIALIAGGAFGLFLANYVKERGKQAVHIAGALQLLFGIKGSRWLIMKDGKETLPDWMNEHWVYPLEEDCPKKLDDFIKGEGGSAYWK